MPIYTYVKVQPQPYRKAISAVSTLFVFAGLSLITWVAYPIVAFELFYAPRFISLIQPIPEMVISEAMENKILGDSIAKNPNMVAEAGVDYTKASTWFPKATVQKLDSDVTAYTLSIPKLGIDNAQVRIGSEDLSKSLIHWGGSVLPGEYGNTIIFGHSTLIWLYNPKNYTSIFSKLPDLNRGDDIYFTVKNATYRYQVFDMRVVSPESLEVLEQKYDDAYVTLITCVPQGTYLKRLVVKARLVKF